MSKGWKHQDSQAELEAQRYENPIPSRTYIMEVLKSFGVPVTHKKLCKSLGLKAQSKKQALEYRLKAMIRDGQLVKNNNKQTYGLVKKLSLIKGKVQGTREGHGFFATDKNDKQLYISLKSMLSLFDGDVILARAVKQDYKGRTEAVPVEILERNTTKIVGKYCVNKSGIGYLIPENNKITHRISIKNGKIVPTNGQYVVAQIIEYPTENSTTIAKIIEVIGYIENPRAEIDVAVRSYNIPHSWSKSVAKETKKVPLKVIEEDKKYRVDLRQLPFVTIDAEDAKDFDDAVFCTSKKTGGWRLYVAIADASHYVKLGTNLDEEARNRGNSIYFPECTLPMLPEKLSNGICSLNPSEDRLVITCEMTISANGRLSGYKFYEAIINSQARLTYNIVNDLLNNKQKKSADNNKYNHLLEHLKEFHEFYQARITHRELKGAIQFDTVETQIIFNKNKKIKKIVPIVRNVAHKMIEEAMLCANIAAAKLFSKNNFLALYRSHEGICTDKQFSLAEFLAGVGISISKTKTLKAKDIAILLNKIKKRPDFKIIQTVILRSMSPALYSEINQGHFGLSFNEYTHFTSPIRRYPDLLVHRAIRQLIRGNKYAENTIKISGATKIAKKYNYPYTKKELAELGVHCSATERRADIATRSVVTWLKCQYAKKHVGKCFSGTVTTVTSFGMFIELDDILVEGLLHVSNLDDDYYRFDKIHHKLVANNTNTIYKLGTKLEVIISHVDIESKMIDLLLKPSRTTKSTKKSKSIKKSSSKSKPKAKTPKIKSTKIKSVTKKAKTSKK